MVKPRLIWGVSAAVIVGALALAGCAPHAELSSTGEEDQAAAVATDTGLRPLAPWQVSPSENPDDFLGDIYDAMDDRAAEYPVEIITYEDGTQTQRTPQPTRDSTAHVRDYISWNTYRLDADNRGCIACHDDLTKLVQTIGDAPHPEIDNLGIDVGVRQCIDCHDTHLGGRYDSQFSGLIHGIHTGNAMFDEQGGTCWSCHYGTVGEAGSEGSWTDAGMQLWDNVKHKVLRGITTLDNESFTGEFTVDQDHIQSGDELWSYNYMQGREEQVSATRWGRNFLGMEPDPATDGVYDEWAVTIGGEVSNPVTLTLNELIEQVGPETRILTMQCANNGEGGTYITNQEVTGIPISKIAELVGVSPDAVRLDASSADGRTAEVDYNWVKQHDAYLVYEIGGKPISYETGYPIQLWVAGWVADEFNKAVNDLSFTSEPYEAPAFYKGAYTQRNGERVGQPTTGICYLREGQILNVGEPFTFQGYASSIGQAIEKVEISFDHGKTWQSFDTPNNDLTKWTWWNYTWTPDKAGSYCIMVRAVDDAGAVTGDPHEVMVTVKDGSEAK